MGKKTKKVIMFIVEGPTDEDTLSPVIKRLFQNNDIRFHIVHGDITTDFNVNEREIIKEVNSHIEAEMRRYGYKKSDIIQIVHLLDTDGAFLPESCIIKGDAARIRYENDSIICHEPDKIAFRNRKKKAAVMRLKGTKTIKDIPYMALYMSRNLEHLLHNISEDLSDDEKIELADAFADRYIDNTEEFVEFISGSSFTVKGNLQQTWDFIFEGTNSMNRYSNFHLMLETCREQ